MKLVWVICFCLLTSVCAAQGIPEGTTRVVPSFNSTETYYGSRGEYLGRSTTNVHGGRTYTNSYGPSFRSVQTYNGGQRFYKTTTTTRTRSYSNYGHFNSGKLGGGRK